MTTKEAVTHVCGELKNDIDYRRGWEANIAMAFYDCTHWYKKETGKRYLTMVDIHKIANRAANHFLDILMRNRD